LTKPQRFWLTARHHSTGPDHSQEEDRYITVGMSFNHRLLIVAHAERETRIRLISARELTTTERTAYERGNF
jgi:uncharacterized DUF497 family protein